MESIDAQGLEGLRCDNGVELVDVRTDEEIRRGVIEGARHIPLHLLPSRYLEIPPGRPVVFYCQTGARSMQAGAFLAQRGWPRVYNLSGGLVAWLRSGLSVTLPEGS